MRNYKIISLIIIIGLFSCVSKAQIRNEVSGKFAAEFGIDVDKVIYQYYQKFGFTDLCEDMRMVTRSSTSPKLKNSLPITKADLERINNFPNKVDSINDTVLKFRPNIRMYFEDIELDYSLYQTEKFPNISLTEGEYEIEETEFNSIVKIYDKQNHYLYIEVHRCDGN